VDDLESLGDLAVGVGVGSEVRCRGGQSGLSQRSPRPRREQVGRAHATQIGDQLPQRREADCDGFAIGDGERESGAAEQVTRRAEIDLGVDSRRSGFGVSEGFGGPHCGAKARQTARSGEGGKQQAVGSQRAADQGQGARQVVNAVQHADRDDEIEDAVGEGQAVLVTLNPRHARGEGAPGIDRDHVHAAGAEAGGEIANTAAEIERGPEVAPHQIEALEQFVGRTPVQIESVVVGRGGAISPEATEPSVERHVLGAARLHARCYSKARRAAKKTASRWAEGEGTMPRPVHFEIHSADPDRAQRFYENLFGWTFQSWGNGDYRLVTTGDQGRGINGGLVRRRGDPPRGGEPVTSWVCTVDVDDLDAFVARAEAEGGSIALPRMAVPGVGWLAYVKDTEGNILGMMQEDRSAA
jgi:predicted enzyme related to lactoylglutathione lyase